MEIVEELKKSLSTILTAFTQELSGVRTGRPTTALVENIKVNHYGQSLAIKALGAIGILPPRTITIQVWDENAIASVAKAIETSSLNVGAQIAGNVIRVNLPELSSERREELLKHAKKMAEEYRIRIRGAREDANKKVQKAADEGVLNEDQKFRGRELVQKEVDATNKKIEELLEAKVKEIAE